MQRITPKKIQGFVKQLFGQFGTGSALSTARGAANTAVRLVHTLAQGTLLWRTIHKQVFELDASCLIRVDNSRSGADFVLPLITFELKVGGPGGLGLAVRHDGWAIVPSALTVRRLHGWHARASRASPMARDAPTLSCARPRHVS